MKYCIFTSKNLIQYLILIVSNVKCQPTHASGVLVGHLKNNVIHQTKLQIFAYLFNLWDPFSSTHLEDSMGDL